MIVIALLSFAKNSHTLFPHLQKSLDETALSRDELYTLITNKAARGKKGALVALVKSTQADKVCEVLLKMSERGRHSVQEITLDMAASMHQIARRCFAKARLVTDRFHVQQLAVEAVQELRIKHRWEELDKENDAIAEAKKSKEPYIPELLSNGDSPRQLLARSRYLLFKHKDAWTSSQLHRARLLFERYPAIEQAYKLSRKLSDIFSMCTAKIIAFKKMALWYNEVEDSSLKVFRTVARSIETHHASILNYFDNRSTNASAESFNAKIKAFRAAARGVRDINFFLFRLAKLYA